MAVESKIDCRKVKYSTKEFALKDIERIRQKSTRKKVPCRSYLCEECGTWHLTSQRDYKMERIIELKKEIHQINAEYKNQIEQLKKQKPVVHELKANLMEKKLQQVISDKQKKISRLMKENRELIEKNIRLENKISNITTILK